MLFRSFSPFDSDLSELSISTSSARAEPPSKEEVDFILSNNLTQLPAQSGITTCSRIRAQALANQALTADQQVVISQAQNALSKPLVNLPQSIPGSSSVAATTQC